MKKSFKNEKFIIKTIQFDEKMHFSKLPDIKV